MPASEASKEERQAFVELGMCVDSLPVMKAALEQDPDWTGVRDDVVST